MIIGIGHDICDQRRMSRLLDRFGQRFLDRIYTADEQAELAARKNKAAYLAGRFAVKEAVYKALASLIRQACTGSMLKRCPLPQARLNWSCPGPVLPGWTACARKASARIFICLSVTSRPIPLPLWSSAHRQMQGLANRRPLDVGL